MLHLQEKAHFSLEEFRRGKDSPLLSRNPTSGSMAPDGDDDELSVLGGKTRLVSKREPSSPILMERSPVSQNPIVPLPLSPGVHNQLSASVLEYLKSFGPSGQNTDTMYPTHSSTSHGSFTGNGTGSSPTQYSESDISPVSMYGMSTISSSFHTEPTSYIQHQPMQNMLQNNNVQSGSSGGGAKDNHAAFPQYFPVYDYGPSSVNYASGSSYTANNNDHAPMLDSNPMPGHRRSSGSPDGNMQSTWLDFVNTMAMQP